MTAERITGAGHGEAPRAASAAGRAAYAVAEKVAYGVFDVVARLRGGEKALHPHGVVHAATLHVPGGARLMRGTFLEHPGEHDALVRFSRSFGFPRGYPDLLGMAVRLIDVHGPDRHQDLLMVTSVDLPILHHAFVPVRSFLTDRLYSGSLPYRAGEETVILGARRAPGGPAFDPRPEDDIAQLAEAARTGELAFELGAAKVLGRLEPFGRLEIGAPQPEALNGIRTNPWNCGGGLEPIGPLNVLRDAGYKGSQDVWDPDATPASQVR